MPYLTYTDPHESQGQAITLATWICENATILGSRQIGGRLSTTAAAARRKPIHAAYQANAINWPHCHELRITDDGKIWRIVYRIDIDAIVIPEVFQKKTSKTPKSVIDVCKSRLRMYDDASQ